MIISWNSTNQYNMYCQHCYRNAGNKILDELTTQQAQKLIREAAETGFKIFIFSGGEPLLRPDLIPLVAYAKEKGLRPVLGTNGTLIDLKMAKALKNAGLMAAGISLDSMDASKHDHFRNYQGAWSKAIAGMENCQKAGLAFQIHTTVLQWNQHELGDLTDLAQQLGARGHHLFFLVPTGRGAEIEAESLTPEDYESIINQIMSKQRKISLELKPTCAPQFTRIAHELGVDTRFSRGCLAGISYCIISPLGDVQPCAYLDMKLGNVKEHSLLEIWNNNTVLQRLRSQDYGGKCGSCYYTRQCGGCRARAYFYHQGDYMGADPWCLYQGG